MLKHLLVNHTKRRTIMLQSHGPEYTQLRLSLHSFVSSALNPTWQSTIDNVLLGTSPQDSDLFLQKQRMSC